MPDGEPVTRALVALYDFVAGQGSIEDTLARIVSVTAESLAADVGGGVTLLDQAGRAATVGFSDPVIPEVDEAQYRDDAGPCLEATRSGRTVVTDDLRAEPRWPAFAEAATGRGVLSTLSLPLLAGTRVLGALNVYAGRAGAFDDAAVAFGTAFAAQAVIGISYWQQASVAEQLRQAMESRAVIEQAKGVLMASTGCSADEAFDLLRKHSQTENRKVRDIAAELVARQHRA